MEKFREFLYKSLRESDRGSQIEQISGALKNLSDSDFDKICNHFGIQSNDQKLNGSYQIKSSNIKVTEPIFNDESIPEEFADIDPNSRDICHEISLHLLNCINPNFTDYIKITKVKKVENRYSVSIIYTKDGTTAEYIFA